MDAQALAAWPQRSLEPSTFLRSTLKFTCPEQAPDSATLPLEDGGAKRWRRAGRLPAGAQHCIEA